MAVLQECPICNNKQSFKRKKCKCCASLDKLKKAGKIKYWIQYRLPGGKQRKEFVRDPQNIKDRGSYEDTLAADGKRKAQRKEDRIFDMLPGTNSTIDDIASWYLAQRAVKELKTYTDVKCVINQFSSKYKPLMVTELKQTTIEEYQEKMKDNGKASSTTTKRSA